MEADIVQSLQNTETSDREYSPAKYKQAWLHAWQQSAYSQQNDSPQQAVKTEAANKELQKGLLTTDQNPINRPNVEILHGLNHVAINQNIQLKYANPTWQLVNSYGKSQLNGQVDILQGQVAETPVVSQQKNQYQINNKILQQVKGKLTGQKFSDINTVVYTKGSDVKLFIRDYKRLSSRYLEKYLRTIDQELKNLGLILKTIVINGKSYSGISPENINKVVKDFVMNNNSNNDSNIIK